MNVTMVIEGICVRGMRSFQCFLVAFTDSMVLWSDAYRSSARKIFCSCETVQMLVYPPNRRSWASQTNNLQCGTRFFSSPPIGIDAGCERKIRIWQTRMLSKRKKADGHRKYCSLSYALIHIIDCPCSCDLSKSSWLIVAFRVPILE
jgi:hypothetical protein